LREENPIAMSPGASISLIDLYFEVTNLSPLDLVLDRMLVEVWFGQPTFNTTLLRRHLVPAGEVTKGVHLRQMLADNQKKQVEAFTGAP